MRRALALIALLAALPARADISFVAAGAASVNVPPLPAGWAQNDILVVVCYYAGAVTVPTGWTQQTNDTTLKVFWKRATATESAPAFTGGAYRCRMAAFRGAVTTGTPFEATGTVAYVSGSGGASTTAPSVTTLTAGAWVLIASDGYANDMADVDLSAGAPVAPATSVAFSDSYSMATPPEYAVGLTYGLRPTPGATGISAPYPSYASGDVADQPCDVSSVQLAMTPASYSPASAAAAIIFIN